MGSPPREGGFALKSGHRMPAVGFGTAHVTKSGVLRALEAGARHLDCARMYGNAHATRMHASLQAWGITTPTGLPRCQRLVSHALYPPPQGNEVYVGQAILESGVPRQELFVTSKLYMDEHGDVEASCRQALHDLRLAYLGTVRRARHRCAMVMIPVSE